MADILFIKTSSLGDVIHHMPALTEARAQRPDARFAWLAEEAFAPLVRLLEEGELDLVALGRALLSEPQWPTKVREGRLDEIRPYSKADEARYH